MARILVIDKNIAVQMALRICLEEVGHVVVVAGDGEMGIRAAKDAPPDLLAASQIIGNGDESHHC